MAADDDDNNQSPTKTNINVLASSKPQQFKDEPYDPYSNSPYKNENNKVIFHNP